MSLISFGFYFWTSTSADSLYTLWGCNLTTSTTLTLVLKSSRLFTSTFFTRSLFPSFLHFCTFFSSLSSCGSGYGSSFTGYSTCSTLGLFLKFPNSMPLRSAYFFEYCPEITKKITLFLLDQFNLGLLFIFR
jgi:hypothetical protein